MLGKIHTGKKKSPAGIIQIKWQWVQGLSCLFVNPFSTPLFYWRLKWAAFFIEMPGALHSMLVNSLLPHPLLGESRTVTVFSVYGHSQSTRWASVGRVCLCLWVLSSAQLLRFLQSLPLLSPCPFCPMACAGWRGISFVCIHSVYVSTRMQMYTQVQEHTCILGICAIDVCYCLPLLFAILCFDTGSLPESEACGFS